MVVNLQHALDLIDQLHGEGYHRSKGLHDAINKFFGIPPEMIDELYAASLHRLTQNLTPDADELKKYREEYIAKLEAMYQLETDPTVKKQ
jgi:CII-binding regulator of phage lambda lysogenization HflD